MKVCVVSTSRADFGIYLPLLHEFEQVKDFKLVTIKKQSDWVIVLGDTWPMLDATIEACKLNIPVAHIHGGDVTGSIDESIRHAITRFAHIHFPSLPEHAERLKKMGEEKWRIHVVGPLGIYAMPEASFIPEVEVKKQLCLDDRPIILVIQHPVSTERQYAARQMKETLFAVDNPAWQPVVIYPNGDPGSAEMVDIIEQFEFKRYINLPYLQFLSLLKISSVVVGNSSCGLVEAPLFGVPCVNVGTRQDGRTAGNSVFPCGYDSAAIAEAVSLSLRIRNIDDAWRYPARNPYLGYADGPQRIINVLRETKRDLRLLQKRLAY